MHHKHQLLLAAFATTFALGACATPNARPPSDQPLPAVPSAPVFEPQLDARGTCVNALDLQTQKDIALLEGSASTPKAPLSGVVVLSFPQTRKEINEWNQMAVAAVRVYSADRNELPLESVLIATDEQAPQIYRLPAVFPLSPVKELAANSPWRAKTGPYVQTLYVFAPLRLLMGKKAELTVRLAGRMSPLTLLRLPLPGTALPKAIRGLPWTKVRENESRMPEPAPVLAALARDFCLGR